MQSVRDQSIQAWLLAQQRMQDLKDQHNERGASELITTLMMAGGFIAISILVLAVFRTRTSEGLDCLNMTGTIPEGCTAGTEVIVDG